MNLIQRIELLPEKKLIGKRTIMSLANNKTGELWRSFMPLRKEIQGRTGTELYSLQLYGLGYFNNFELLGEKYRNGDSESEETIRVPVKNKE